MANTTHFPKSQIEVSVCDLAFDAKAIIVQDTDKPADERWIMELYAFQNNMVLTDNLNPFDGPISDFGSTQATGKVQYNLYHATDRWKNPTTGNIEIIPDYYGTVWSSTGAAYFDVTIGAAKSARFPNHGQQLYDISSGRLGWDYVNGVSGINQGFELFMLIEFEMNYIYSNTGHYPSAFSYRNGQNGGYLMMMKYLLGGRNSDLIQTDLLHNGKTDYGQNKEGDYLGLPQQATTRANRINSQNTTRFKDMTEGTVVGTWGSESQVRTYCAGQVTLSKTNKGIYNDFIHRYQWSTAAQRAKFGTFTGALNTAAGSDFVWRTSYGDAMEYLFYREMINRIASYEADSKVHIVIEKIDPYKNNLNSGISERLPLTLIRVPISVRINLTGTVLAGKDIQTNYGTILPDGVDEYIIQIPFDNPFEGFTGCILSETNSTSYISLDLPAVVSSIKSGNSITVNTDKPTTAALFKAVGGADISTSVIHARSNTLGTQHIFDITGFTSYDFRCGINTETKQSILSGVIV